MTTARQETREAKADTGARVAMADQGSQASMAVLFFGKV